MAIKYKWLAQKLEALAKDNLAKGVDKLPTEAEIGQKYRVSRQTVRHALSLLEASGIILRKQGSGAYLTGRLSKPEENIVEVLISSEQDYLYPQILHDIRQELATHGFSARVSVTNNQIFTEGQLLKAFRKNPPRGILAEGCKSALPSPNQELYRSLAKQGAALVFLHSPCPGLNEFPCVKDDNAGGSALLVRHLVSQGHRAIGGIFKRDDLQGVERYQGFAEAMEELSLPDDRVGWYGSLELDRLLRYQDTGFLKLLAREAWSDCTAVVCYNDVIAYHLIRVFRELGLKLPEQMAVAAFDNTYLSSSEELPFTTLTHRPHEMGTRAAALMVQRLKGLPAQSQEVPWEILIRESTAGAGR